MTDETTANNSVSANKAVAHRFFMCFTEGDVEGALALMREDATWRMPDRRLSPAGRLYSKQKMARLFGSITTALKGPLMMEVKSSIGEGNAVALEVESAGDLKNGRAYRQEYHILMEFRDGKIAAVREYLDTQHASDIWVAPLSDEERAAAGG